MPDVLTPSQRTAACCIYAARRPAGDTLIQAGWQVIVIWACNLTKDKLHSTMQQTAVALNANYLRLLQNTAHRLSYSARLNREKS